MNLQTRKLVDRSFTGMGFFSVLLMGAVLLFLLVPIVSKGVGAYVFRGTVEHRRFCLDHFERGNREKIKEEVAQVEAARKPLWDMIAAYRSELDAKEGKLSELKKSVRKHPAEVAAEFEELAPGKISAEMQADISKLAALTEEDKKLSKTVRDEVKGLVAVEIKANHDKLKQLKDVTRKLSEVIGPNPEESLPVLTRQQYGQTRWDRTEYKLHELLNEEKWIPNPDDPGGPLVQAYVPRVEDFKGTSMEPFFAYAEEHIVEMMHPHWTFYWQFIKDKSFDSHFFGGVGPEVLGTIYLALGAMLFAVPIGVIAAIYLCEYAKPGRVINLIRTCISTLAGVPSIVFGLFGLAFFLNTLHVTQNKSVLAGSMTLALMVLPTIIRASEEAILSVPKAYKEAALGLGAGRWHTIVTVVLPAALPGILTGIVISMGRAAGETAPIIFTAAVSMGDVFPFHEALVNPTTALPWNIYNICTEHEAVDEIRHVQFGMVFTLVTIVLLLNLAAIIMRARIAKKLKG